jgi:hypothetical protein
MDHNGLSSIKSISVQLWFWGLKEVFKCVKLCQNVHTEEKRRVGVCEKSKQYLPIYKSLSKVAS